MVFHWFSSLKKLLSFPLGNEIEGSAPSTPTLKKKGSIIRRLRDSIIRSNPGSKSNSFDEGTTTPTTSSNSSTPGERRKKFNHGTYTYDVQNICILTDWLLWSMKIFTRTYFPYCALDPYKFLGILYMQKFIWITRFFSYKKLI